MVIGEKLRQMRIKNSLTQEELANRCELSKGFISQVERDITSPSIATLIDILESLGSNLREFFNDSGDDKIVFRKDDAFVQENDDLGHMITWIVPNAQKNDMEPILIRLAKGGRSSVYDAHECEVFGYVLTGAVVLHIGDKRHKVKKGESFYHNANSSYYLSNDSSGDATVLWVSAPPSF
ncbi:MAG: XRE family transcriptional regulator [Defluviitaleaceae bacterium]|nr:XRE family transcriptional regulator [Defluviitaleaceae bacterium]